MIDLILAVVSSMLVSVIMRVSEKHIHNNISMLASNYLMCTVMAVICAGTWNLFPVSADGFSFSVGLGLISGVFYMSSFMLLQWNTKKNGIVLSSMFMKLGVMVPTLMAIVVFHEKPKMVQVLGMMLAVVAILLINMEKGSARAASSTGLVFLLIAGGMTDGMAKIGCRRTEKSFPALYIHCGICNVCGGMSAEKAGIDQGGFGFWASNRHSQLRFGVVLIAFAVLDSGDDCLSDV